MLAHHPFSPSRLSPKVRTKVQSLGGCTSFPPPPRLNNMKLHAVLGLSMKGKVCASSCWGTHGGGPPRWNLGSPFLMSAQAKSSCKSRAEPWDQGSCSTDLGGWVSRHVFAIFCTSSSLAPSHPTTSLQLGCSPACTQGRFPRALWLLQPSPRAGAAEPFSLSLSPDPHPFWVPNTPYQKVGQSCPHHHLLFPLQEATFELLLVCSPSSNTSGQSYGSLVGQANHSNTSELTEWESQTPT